MIRLLEGERAIHESLADPQATQAEKEAEEAKFQERNQDTIRKIAHLRRLIDNI